MSTFYLVRHAHADWTPNEARSLSKQGCRDAERVADILQSYPVQLIYASPFRHAQQSVTPLAARLGLPVHIISDLREQKLCAGKAEDFSEAAKATWTDATFAHLGGESNATAQQRGVAVVHSYQPIKRKNSCS